VISKLRNQVAILSQEENFCGPAKNNQVFFQAIAVIAQRYPGLLGFCALPGLRRAVTGARGPA
jgi:hypothetical protein